MNGIVYVPVSGYLGDCGNYHGWVVGVEINNPSKSMAGRQQPLGGGIWGHSGVASDGTNMFVITGNTFNTGGNWMGGEAIIRLQAGPVFTGQPTDYWAPTQLVLSSITVTPTLAASAPCSSTCPEPTLRSWCSRLGKDCNAYLVNRNNLGGIAAPVPS